MRGAPFCLSNSSSPDTSMKPATPVPSQRAETPQPWRVFTIRGGSEDGGSGDYFAQPRRTPIGHAGSRAERGRIAAEPKPNRRGTRHAQGKSASFWEGGGPMAYRFFHRVVG